MTAPVSARVRAIERKEIALSAAINAVLSVAFFALIFGRPRPLTFWGPDYFAMDFIPQFAAVSLMSALVPAFVARRKLAQASGGDCAPARKIVLRAVGLCLCALVIAAAAIAFVWAAGWSELSGGAALGLKAALGGALGMATAKLALQPLSYRTINR